ncbi:MAG: copper homeostasis protein CutC [Pirellulales bacterium]
MILEICVETLAGAKAAQAGRADRIEVCASLALAGLTPSTGLVEQCVMLEPPRVMMMIRPHARDFVYDCDEIGAMLNDIQDAKRLGVQGVVFGALTHDGQLDKAVCRRLVDAARPLEITFHRAFDLVREPMQALEQLIDLGFDRVLTSGQADNAVSGIESLKKLVQVAAERISIIVAGGVRAENVQQLKETGAREFHSSARKLDQSASITRKGQIGELSEVSELEVRRLAIAVHSDED